MTMVEQLNHLASLWWDWSAAMFWQVSLLILLIGCVDLLIRRWAWPQLRYALWSLILIKLLLPPTLSLPSAVVPSLQPLMEQTVQRLNSPRPIVVQPAVIADLPFEVGPKSVAGGASSVSISNLKSQIPDAARTVNPQSAIRNPQFVWQVHAMLVWLAGTMILGIWLFLRLHSLCSRRACRSAAASLPQSFYNQMADCANRLGLRHIPQVVVTKKLTSPAVFGVLRPVLLMPKGYLSKLSRRDTEHMLLHELAHVKRGDLVMHSLYMLLQIGYWYNPLLWLVRRQMHHLRELSCDATVANLLRERTAAYRQTLLETARRLLATSAEPGLGLLGLFEDSNRLVVRLDWLTKPTWRYRTMKRAIVVTTAALMIACVLPMARAQESASSQQEPVVKRVDDPLSQQMAQMEAQLNELKIQQEKLQDQLRALAKERDQMLAKDKQKPQKLPMVVRPQRPGGVNVQTKVENEIEQREERVTEEQIKQEAKLAQDEASRAAKEAALVAKEAAKAAKEAQKAQDEHWEQWGEQMRAWSDQMRQWQNSDEMKHWQEQMEHWAQEQAGQHEGAGGEHVNSPGPMPPMPAMPQMGEAPGRVVVPTPHPQPMPHIVVPHSEARVPEMNADEEGPAQTVPCGEYVVESFPSDATLQVENNVGSVAIEGVEGSTCTVKATARIKDTDKATAEDIARGIKVYVTPTDGRVQVRAELPEGLSEEQRKHVLIDFQISVPDKAQVKVVQKVGGIRLASLGGDVKAVTDVGSIEARQLRGDVALQTNVGNIAFVAPRELSVKIRAHANVGAISSKLPLEITQTTAMPGSEGQGALGSNAKGVVGSGDKKIDLTANVGSIQIQKAESDPF
jgi:beta-lactamase regulating signal transducer with metallopeptidase domain